MTPVTRNGRTSNLRVGDRFNPWQGACGFFPSNLVSRQKGLTDGQKLLYARLVRFAGRDGRCFPAFPTLAAELGKSLSQVKRDTKVLEKVGLIAHENRAGRRSNTYYFLWHPYFEGSSVSLQAVPPNPEKRPDGSAMRLQGPSQASGDGLSREVTSDHLKAHVRPPNSEQGIFSKNNSTTEGAVWSQDEKDSAFEALVQVGSVAGLGRPDADLVTAVLSTMLDLADLQLWLDSSRQYLQTARGWGLFVKHSCRWPERRSEAIAHRDRLLAASARELADAEAFCREFDEQLLREKETAA